MFFLKRVVLLALIIIFNSASFADTDSRDNNKQAYPIDEGISLVSNLKFRYGKNPKIFVKAVFPSLESDTPNENIDNFNQLVTNLIQEEYENLRALAKQNQSLQQTVPRSEIRNDLYMDYDASVIKSGNNHIVSVRFSIERSVTGMAHPTHQHRVLNYDLNNGKDIELDELFKANSDYLNVISAYTRKILSKRLTNNQMVMTGTEANPENYKQWNIKPNGLLFTFEENQVAPYVNGAQTVLVPYTVLQSVISANSPIAGCIHNKKRCMRSNLLTGGFIDEAINAHHRTLNPILGKL